MCDYHNSFITTYFIAISNTYFNAMVAEYFYITNGNLAELNINSKKDLLLC